MNLPVKSAKMFKGKRRVIALTRSIIGGFTSSKRTIGVLLMNCSRSGMFYCLLWYVSLYVVVCGMSSEKPYSIMLLYVFWTVFDLFYIVN